MALINRKWTPAHADEWTKEDWFTIILSPVAYVLLTIGVGLSFLLLPIGFIILFIGILVTILMHWIIDPKLKKISNEYEKRQHEYLEQLERKARWEEHHG